MSRLREKGAFLLLETVIGVAIFAVGILGMARAVNACLEAERLKNEYQCARLALENRMAEIEAGAVLVQEAKSEDLKGQFSAITMKQSRKPLQLRGDKNQQLNNVYVVDLEASWKSHSSVQSSQLTFYVYHAQ
jgi:hypothetical protein